VLEAISTGVVSKLKGFKFWSDSFVLDPVLVRDREGGTTSKSPLELAAESRPEVFDALWNRVDKFELVSDDVYHLLLIFIRRTDYKRFHYVWNWLDISDLTEDDKLYMLSVAREIINKDHRKIHQDVSMVNLDEADLIFKCCWWRFSQGRNLQTWLEGKSDSAYLTHLMK
jgi:hypothetical protein